MEKSLDKANRKFSPRMQARLLLVFCVITLSLIGIMGLLVFKMQIKGDGYAKHVLSRQSYVSSVLPYKRGDILDRNGTVLARSEIYYRLILDPKRLLLNEDQIEPTKAALKEYFGIEPDIIQSILQEKADSQYVIVVKNLLHDTVEAFKVFAEENTDIIGVWFEEEYVRSYPYDSLACDVIGFTSTDNIGYYGIEEYYNNELNGTNGREYGYYDSSLNIERIVAKPENGNSVITTIDVNAQRIIQKYINEFNTEYGSKNIGMLVMDPNSGEVIAMASNQEYNLNTPRDLTGSYTEAEIAAMSEEQKMEALNTLWKNDVISSGYEPGSTFKPITVAAGLEEAIISEDDTFECDGVEVFGDVRIKCNKRSGHGHLTLGETLMKSCNDAMMQISAKEGSDIFYSYENSFGFGKKTGIDLPGEAAGILISLEKLKATELATSSFGQSMDVTMIQMAAAYSSLVNGGKYYLPHVAKQIINDSGATVKQIDKLLVKQTVSEENSKFFQEYMYRTVEEGTAKPAKVAGYAVGGKTGTAEKLPRGNDKYIVSFLGGVPAINPQMVIYVWIDEPQNVERQDDSSLATTLASKVLTELLPALGIYPDGEIDYLLPVEEEADEESGNTEDEDTNTPEDNNQENNNQEDNNQESNNQEDNNQEDNNQEDNNQEDNNQEDADNAENSGDGQDNENSENTDNPEDIENDTQENEEQGDMEDGEPDGSDPTPDENSEEDTQQNDEDSDEDGFNGAAIG
jgi:stage V sporulation protein D (sporulation-specific penicillin-binding protein)